MNIRETGMREKYKKAKSFVNWYESALFGIADEDYNLDRTYIWRLRYEICRIRELQRQFQGLGDVYQGQIDCRLEIIKEALKRVYGK